MDRFDTISMTEEIASAFIIKHAIQNLEITIKELNKNNNKLQRSILFLTFTMVFLGLIQIIIILVNLLLTK